MGVNRPEITIALQAANFNATTITNQANAEQFMNNLSRTHFVIDTTRLRECRLQARINVASASANNPRIYLRTSGASFSTTLADYSAIGVSATEVEVSLAATGLIDSGWIAMDSTITGDFYFALLQNGGDGAADPTVSAIYAQFR
jgi:hypothetical protein